MAAPAVLREWTRLLSGDRGASVVQQLQDGLQGRGESLDGGGDDGDEDGRNFYEPLTGDPNNATFSSQVSQVRKQALKCDATHSRPASFETAVCITVNGVF